MILNGAAARLVEPGDRVIVITYAEYDEAELAPTSRRSCTSTSATVRFPAEQAVQRAGSNLVWMRTGTEPNRSRAAPRPRRLVA